MTVSTQTTKTVYQGNGSTTQFTVPFRFVKEADLRLVVRSDDGTEDELTLTTDYTVSGAGDPSGGACVLSRVLSSDETLTILRDPDLVQETDYQENDAFPAETHEAALDLLTMIAQANRERIDRAIKLPVSSTLTDLAAPLPVAGRTLVWNQDADGLENGPDADQVAAAQGHAYDAAISAGVAAEAWAAAQAARDICIDLSEAEASQVGYDPSESGLSGETVQLALDELAWEQASLSGISSQIRNMELGFFQLAEAASMSSIQLVDKRIDTFEDGASINQAASSGYTLDEDQDLVTSMPGQTAMDLTLSAATFQSVAGSITQFTVDTADASGHFNASAGSQVLAGCRMVINGADYVITALTNDGDATDEVAFNGVLAAGTYDLTGIYGLVYDATEGVIRLSGFESGHALIDAAEGTLTGCTLYGGTLAMLFDGETQGDYATEGARVQCAGEPLYFTKTWSAARTITRLVLHGAESWDFLRIDGGSHYSGSIAVTLEGSDDGSAWTTLLSTSFTNDSSAATSRTFDSGIDTSQAFLQHRVSLSSDRSDSGSYLICTEAAFYEPDMAMPVGPLYTAVLPAVSQEEVRQIVSMSIVDAGTANAVARYAFSFDNGTSWIAWDGATSTWGAVDLSAPNPTAWSYRYECLNIAEEDWPTPTGDILTAVAMRTLTLNETAELSSLGYDIIGPAEDMVLVLDPVAASAAPASARLFAVLRDVEDPVALNTDLKAWASRNGGTDWDQISLAKVGDLLTDRYTVEGVLAAFGHADGGESQAVFRLTSHNNTPLELLFLSQGLGV